MVPRNELAVRQFLGYSLPVKLRFAWLVILLFDPLARADIFLALAKDAVVCYGEKAPTEERQAAIMLAEKFRAAGGPKDNLVTAETLKKDSARAALSHIIAVGTWSSNIISRECWGKIAVDPLQKAKVEHLAKPPDYFSVGGFGRFTGADVGYIEPDNNLYTLYLRSMGTLPKHRSEDKQHPEEFFVFKITGNGTAGVVRAAKAFAETNLLVGVLPSPSQKLDADWDAQPKDGVSRVGAPQITTSPPAFAPKGLLSAGNHSAGYLGWYQSNTVLYHAFAETTKQRAKRIWRIKYRTEEGFRKPASFLSANPHGPNRGNELFVAEMNDETSAKICIKAFQTIAEKQHPEQAKFTEVEIAGWKGIRATAGDAFLARGKFFVMSSLPRTHSPLVFEKLGSP